MCIFFDSKRGCDFNHENHSYLFRSKKEVINNQRQKLFEPKHTQLTKLDKHVWSMRHDVCWCRLDDINQYTHLLPLKMRFLCFNQSWCNLQFTKATLSSFLYIKVIYSHKGQKLSSLIGWDFYTLLIDSN